MIKNSVICGVVVCVCLMSSVCLGDGSDGLTALFPDIQGWVKDGDPEIYYPESLFEYINGAADVYLSYEFEELAALNYDSEDKRSLTVDVYRHSDLRNAFGIYSQEKPQDGRFLTIGTQAYYDKGVLNFFHGVHYVKLLGFYLGDDDEAILKSLARSIADRLDGESAFPNVLSCFPAERKIENSERYLARDVLGHSFLHSAYAADYEVGDETLRAYIIEGDTEADAGEMLKKYLELVEKKGGQAVVDEDTYRFTDPRRSSAGPMNLRTTGRYVWGLFTGDADLADGYLAEIEANLEKAELID